MITLLIFFILKNLKKKKIQTRPLFLSFRASFLVLSFGCLNRTCYTFLYVACVEIACNTVHYDQLDTFSFSIVVDTMCALVAAVVATRFL